MAIYKSVVTGGNWSAASTWQTMVDDEYVNGVPGSGDIAIISTSGANGFASVDVDTQEAASAAAIDVQSGILLLGLDLSYAGAFTIGGSDFGVPGILYLDDHTLTLSGSSNTLSGALWGTGTLKVTGSAVVDELFNLFYEQVGQNNYDYFGPSAILEDVGSITQLRGGLSLFNSWNGDDGLLQIDAGATYTINSDSSISGNVVNNGTLTIAGDDQIGQGTFANNGTLQIDAGDALTLNDATLGGTISGSGKLITSGVYVTTPTIANLSAIEIGSGFFTLGIDLSYAAELTIDFSYNPAVPSGILYLDDHTLTLTGSSNTLRGALWGPGTLLVTGAADINGLSNGYYYQNGSGPNQQSGISYGPPATLEDAGAITQSSSLSLSSNFGDGLLQIDAGATYTINSDSSISGNVVNNGTLTVAGDDQIGQGTFTNNGTLQINAGDALHVNSTSILGGIIKGGGTLSIDGGLSTVTVAPTVATWKINEGEIATAAALTYAGKFTSGVATIDVSDGALTLRGAATLADVSVFSASPHNLNLYGPTSVSSLTIFGNAIVVNAATATQSGGSITIGDGGATDKAELYNAAAGIWNIADDSGMARGADPASFIYNLGLFEKTGGTGTSTVAVSMTDLGSVAATSGTLAFAGPSNSFAGAISGAGTVLFSGGASTLKAGASATVASLSESGAGTALTIAENLGYASAFTQGAGSKLAISAGDTLTLSGTNLLSGATSGAGSLALAGGDTTFSAGATLSMATWSLAGSGTTATLGAALVYAGAFSAGAGTQLAVNGGALTLKGATTLVGATVSSTSAHSLNLYGATSVSGLTIAGNALVDNFAAATQSGDSITVGDGVSTDKAELYNAAAGIWNIADDSGVARGTDPASLIYNLGAFEKTGGTGTSTAAVSMTDLGSVAATSGTLAFAGPSNSFAGAISGAGAVTFSGGASTLKAGASATVASLSESGVGTALYVAENLSYAGAFTQGAGAKLVVNSGDTLTLSGTNLLSGATSGAGWLALAGGDTTFSTGATLSMATWSLAGSGTTATLGATLAYTGAFSAGAGTQLALTDGALTLRGATTLAGVTITGASPHNLNLYGATSVSGLTIAGNAIVVNAATATQSGGSITVGDGVSTDKAELYNAAAGVWNITDDSGVARGTDQASFIYNLGLFEKTGGTGTSTVGATFNNSGQTLVTTGTLDLHGSLTGTGTDTVSGSSTLKFDSSVAAGQTIAFIGSGSTVLIGALQSFSATLSGYDAGGTGGTNDSVKLLGSWAETGFSENGAGTLATLTLSNGTIQKSLNFAGNYTSASFHLSQSGGFTTIS